MRKRVFAIAGCFSALSLVAHAQESRHISSQPFSQPVVQFQTPAEEGIGSGLEFADPTAVEPTQYVYASADAEPSEELKNLTEEDIKQIVAKYLKEKEAADEAKLTPQQKKDKALAMSAKWNNGLELSTKDKAFRTHIGGRYQFDTAWFSAPANVNQNINNPYSDGVDFRRARLRVDGTMYEVHEYAAEFDFVNSIRTRNQPGVPGFTDATVAAPTDLWWTIKEVPIVGNIRIGSQKEQVGFEHIVSSRFLPFMERSFNQDTFYGNLYNGFQPGVSIFNTYGNESGVWNMGLFKPTNNVFDTANGDGDYAVSGRLTNLLYYANDGEQLIHVGVSGRQASSVGIAGSTDRFETFRTRDAVRSGLSAAWPSPASVTMIGDDMQWGNGEFVVVNGSWTLQSEYLVSGLHDAKFNRADVGQNITYHGGYVQVLYFLTGEHDHYSKKNGAFERVVPHCNFFKPNKCGGGITGMGAWQVGFRYNHLDLNDKGLNGGILDNYTTGLNWFWNPNMKWQFNYSATDRDVSAVAAQSAGSGWIHGFGTRVAMDF